MPRPSRHAPDTTSRAAHWSDRAACRAEEDRSIFFPEDFPRAEVPLVATQARAVCQRCPVIEACLEEALARPEWSGVWGGLDKDQRKALRRREQKRRRRDARKQGGADVAEAAAGTS
ncbi:WhiB family transcriptional regulator [Streptomyces sp. ND04-05B]|uniref:WhiB family transcriptional regulator n=1 Tax=Streptomyces sp. ND04-05B TaxID=3028693 RepID=UPI0029B8CCE7|nr:WhiB family transcriptional regulator [Streptomyces sp. ND04-05B]MDX3070472.1 WhiB family transcriptional regulator [Streptomyces sp. ND04-05B]